jgi:hypothetical protein
MARKTRGKKAQNTTGLLKGSGGFDYAGYYKTSMVKIPLFNG